MELTVTLDRGPDDDALVIRQTPPPSGQAGLWVPSDGVQRPTRGVRRTYAPDSAYFPGRVLLAAVEDASTLPLVIYAGADTSAALEALIDELEAATTQFAYDLTLSIDGQDRTWLADPELPQWGEVDPGMVAAHMARASIVIPLNPA